MAEFDLSRVVIRKAVESDLPHMRGESNAPYLQFLFQTAYQGMLRGEQVLWVAEHAGIAGLVGQVFVQFKSVRETLADGVERAYFYSFHVAEPYRRNGLGSHLLNWLENDLRGRGFSLVTLTVEKENTQARRLYERHGYRLVGEEVVNVRSERVDEVWTRIEEYAWRMEKPLFSVKPFSL